MADWLSRHRSWLIISLAVIALGTWIATGPEQTADTTDTSTPGIVTVGVKLSEAEKIADIIEVQGQLEPEQIVRVRARTSGEVEETPVAEGSVVEAGERIARLAINDREARLREAEAAVKQARGDFRAARDLADKGLQAKLQVQRAQASLEAAKARLESIELDIGYTRIAAPISGILNRQIAREGDFVSAGEPVAQIVQNNPLRAIVKIPQQREAAVHQGQTAEVTTVDGTTHTGEIAYVSSVADGKTRTFRARIRIDNPERDIAAGTSATVRIPTAEVSAHAISPALISRNTDGELGVRVAVDDGGEPRVRFVPVTPLRADARHIWVTGLEPRVRLINLGQGFVRDGDRIHIGEVSAP